MGIPRFTDSYQEKVVLTLERIRAKEGLLKPEYNQQLDQWLEKLENEPSE
ncbi:MAG: hypothetical protein GYA24_17340 [Candidatus Lokiarchaeota archaeon]|nr:hypothetical protein [Candidatus Lokiarchaeota archaeon]